jgi:3-oxoacyl-[acyl-carrier protein] reductase
LANKVAVVTGASSGIGAEIAKVFGHEGATVIVNYRSSRNAAEAVAEAITSAGGKAVALQGDVANAEEVNVMMDSVLQHHGHVDILANIAGADILTGGGAEVTDLDKLQRLLDVDLKGTMFCCWKLAPLMRTAGGGAILNMSWDLALHGMEGRNPEMFAAVKAGVIGFSKSLARSYAPEVRVNQLAPGWIETAFVRDVMSQEARSAVLAQTPLRRFGQPLDVANAALFLASDEASFITGQTLYINGGLAT